MVDTKKGDPFGNPEVTYIGDEKVWRQYADATHAGDMKVWRQHREATHIGDVNSLRQQTEVTHVGDEKVRRSGSTCVISTACATAMGLSDDCEELTILRKFREDHLLHGSPLGNAVLQQYEVTSRRILDWVERQDNPASLYADLYQRLVGGTIGLIKDGKAGEAISHCVAVIRDYERRAMTQGDGR